MLTRASVFGSFALVLAAILDPVQNIVRMIRQTGHNTAVLEFCFDQRFCMPDKIVRGGAGHPVVGAKQVDPAIAVMTDFQQPGGS